MLGTKYPSCIEENELGTFGETNGCLQQLAVGLNLLPKG